MEQFDLQFKFKGGRNYVHGTDLYNKMCEMVQDLGITVTGQVQMTIHKMMYENLTAYRIRERMIKDPSALFTIINDERKEVFALQENGSAIKAHYPYDEDLIALGAKIEGNVILHPDVSQIEYTNVEKVVALNKVHLKTLFSDNEGKWIFSKLRVNPGFNNSYFRSIKIELSKRIGLRLTKSIIYFDDKKVGEIYFSLT